MHSTMPTLPDDSPGYGDLWTDMSRSKRGSRPFPNILGGVRFVLQAGLMAVPIVAVIFVGVLLGLTNELYGPRSIITRAVIRRYKYYGPYFAKR